MFSPASRKPHLAASRKDRLDRGRQHESPSTPLHGGGNLLGTAASIPDRPATGTPAPWPSRLSLVARIPDEKKSEKDSDGNQIEPVKVTEFPQIVRNVQASLLQKGIDSTWIAGGIDKGTSLSWMICGTQLFIWSYLSGAVLKKCVVLDIPSDVIGDGDPSMKMPLDTNWTICVIRMDISSGESQITSEQCNPAGVILCNQKSQAIAYWPNIYSDSLSNPVINLKTLQSKENDLPYVESETVSLRHKSRFFGNRNLSVHDRFNSIIASAIPGHAEECIALACQSNGLLWLFRCTASGIHREVIFQNVLVGNEGYCKRLIWNPQHRFSEDSGQQFFLLTDREIQCWNVIFAPKMFVRKLWTHEIVGNDGDLGIKKDLAGQKHIWLLDMHMDVRGKEFIVLVATLCKDRVSGSSYIQYSLLTMQYKPGFFAEKGGSMNERALEKKFPLQVIIPKARVEDEDYLFSMRLHVGGKPSGSAVILSGDGIATVTFYWRGSTRLYQFNLPWDAGKVLDASVFPSSESSEEGAWVVLTAKAGVWAIPEKAVLLGGVEPPERSLSRKGSSNEGVREDEKRLQAISTNAIPKRASSEGYTSGNKQKAALTGIAQRNAQDEEAEILLNRLFHDFLSSGNVEGVLENLREIGAFEREGETNVFTRMSKSIVDTLAKHWTTTRGAEFVASAVVSSLLLDKQQKHQKYLHFLALSKCHEELLSWQRHSLLLIMEHGEKLSCMIQLRELQNMLSQNRINISDSPPSRAQAQTSGPLWNLIQLVGEKARRNAVLLMDRDNSEVFYTKISAIEELFNCLFHHLEYIIGGGQPFNIQIKRACEISNACTTVIHTAIRYRDEHKNWYPSLDELTPWNCQAVVRAGLWSIGSSIVQLLKEAQPTDISMNLEIWSQLEGLTDVLLDAYIGVITAKNKTEHGEGCQGLVDEYGRRRDELLDSLYELAKRITELKYLESYKGVNNLEREEAIFNEVTKPLLLIAKRHEGYRILWQLCYDLGNTGLLRSLMHESRGANGGFSYFVFEQLIHSSEYSKLLRLGEEFQDELASFLKEHKDLLWLHEIFLSHYSSASKTLHTFAWPLDDVYETVIEEEPVTNRRLLSLSDRRRLLNLSKIAAVAGNDMGSEMWVRHIEADLQILKLQEEIMRQISDDEALQEANMPLPPGELIKTCLKGRGKELSLIAFEVFSWMSSSFRKDKRHLLEECWRNAADQDDWVGLSDASAVEGWSDEVVLNKLKETVLFKVSNRYYGPNPETYDGGFEEVLPLQNDRVPGYKDANPSVEDILVQHKDFPDAGRLMITAIMMGKVGDTVMTEEDLAMDFT